MREELLAQDKLHEECGIFGAFDLDGGDVTKMIYYGLYALQHRGQTSCGIAVTDKRDISAHKAMGLLRENFDVEKLKTLHGAHGIGHVLYTTSNDSTIDNAQPIVARYVKGNLSIAHNGALTNTEPLINELALGGAIFRTTSDAEIIAYLIARERVKSRSVERAVEEITPLLRGSFSFLVMSPEKLVAARDSFGFRPLSIGRVGNTYIFASETCALNVVGATFIRDVQPGEVVMVDSSGLHTIREGNNSKKKLCIFEYVYFARPDSVVDGCSVYNWRIKAGKRLAEKSGVKADVVIGVPDSAIDAAIGYAQGSGIPYAKGFVKNNYIGRTFIQPTQAERAELVKIKLNVLEDSIRGKRVVMVDDSIVRGTTCANIVKMLKNAGATEVHVAISSPKFMHPCFYGTDVPSRDQLTAHSNSVEQIARNIGADTLTFLDISDLPDITGNCEFCDACFSGDYPDGEKIC